jgi:hypothetical protein
MQAPNVTHQSPPKTLPTPDLQTKVVEAVRTSHSWRNPGKLKLVEKASLSISPRAFINAAENVSAQLGRIDPLLLPDEKHVLLENHGRLELWSIVPRARMWTVEPTREGECVAFDYEIVNNGKSMMVAALFLNVAQGR